MGENHIYVDVLNKFISVLFVYLGPVPFDKIAELKNLTILTLNNNSFEGIIFQYLNYANAIISLIGYF